MPAARPTAPGTRAEGMPDTGDGNPIHRRTLGNPAGKPLVVVHGGPGGGMPGRFAGPAGRERYRIILFDQRNCGESTPRAADPATDLSRNTTAHLVGDMELLREHLGVDKWVIFGGSWGTALALAYAERHPG